MEDYDRKSDTVIQQLMGRVIELESAVKLLRTDFEDHCVTDENTHDKMLAGLTEIRAEQALTREELMRHTSNEELWQSNFKLTLERISVAIEAVKVEVEKTKPMVQTYNDITGAARITKAIVDTVKWLVPMFIGIATATLWFTKK